MERVIYIYRREELYQDISEGEHVVFELSSTTVDGRCDMLITRDHSDIRYTKYYLRGRCIMYGRSFDITKAELKYGTARKIIDMVYPLDKWNVDNTQRQPVVDGPHLQLHLHEYCEVFLSGNRFSHTAVWEMVDAVRRECLAEGVGGIERHHM